MLSNMTGLVVVLNVACIWLSKSVLYSLVVISLVSYLPSKHKVDAVLHVAWFTNLILWDMALLDNSRNAHIITYAQSLFCALALVIVVRRFKDVR